jgi:hypothetical protein
VTRNAFYETPPFSRIVNVKWEEEAWSAAWLYLWNFEAEFVYGPSTCAGYIDGYLPPPDAPMLPDVNSYVIGHSCNWFFDVFFEGASEGLSVSGAPVTPTGSSSVNSGPQIRAHNADEFGNANVIGTSIGFDVWGTKEVGPIACYGNVQGPGDLNPGFVTGSQYGIPILGLEQFDTGVVTCNVTGTIDGAPAVVVSTEMSMTPFGGEVIVRFARS